jgi:hypothetical protein
MCCSVKLGQLTLDARDMVIGALTTVAAGCQIGACLRPGGYELALTQEVVVCDVHDHVARLAPDADYHLLGFL